MRWIITKYLIAAAVVLMSELAKRSNKRADRAGLFCRVRTGCEALGR